MVDKFSSSLKWILAQPRHTVPSSISEPTSKSVLNALTAELKRRIDISKREKQAAIDCPVMTHLHSTKLTAFLDKYPLAEITTKRVALSNDVMTAAYQVTITTPHRFVSSSNESSVVLATLNAINLFERAVV